jgi:hypothetical protein
MPDIADDGDPGIMAGRVRLRYVAVETSAHSRPGSVRRTLRIWSMFLCVTPIPDAWWSTGISTIHD